MSEHVTVRITRLRPVDAPLPFPAYATSGSAGMDLCADVDADLRIAPQETALVPTGIAIELPEGFEAQVRPRSGLAAKHRIGILNSPGTIDSDYRGEVKVILTNFGSEPFTIRRGDRIAQMVVARYARVTWNPTDALADSPRGAGGFGHTGLSTKA